MADAFLFHTKKSGTWSARLVSVVRNFFGGLLEGLAAHQRYHVLSAMSDRALGEIGLKREDIAREAMFPSRRIDA
ncbi:MAG TPA: hypothetical protein VK943_13590 [Arenibaculum sp.]|nr:hypothetical protein [Arenibaculum sp.]